MSGRINPHQVHEELAAAQAARERGNEGMARVCARRAAGWAVGLADRGDPPAAISGNAYLLLKWYADRTEEPDNLREAAGRLTARITEDHTLPHSEDPLRDARRLVEALLGDPREGNNEGASG